MSICFLICFICLFLCVLTGFILLFVQLVVRSNFNCLQRKYECLCVQEMVVLFRCLGRKLKT